MTTISVRSAALAGLVALAGCKKEEPPAPPPPPLAAPAKPPPPAGPMSVSGKSDPTCLGAIQDGQPQAMTVAGKPAEARGSTLVFTAKDEDEAMVFGVVADIKEDTPANLFNLGRYVEFFKAEKAEAIIVTGDLGESESSIRNVLMVLAGAGVPVFTIPGNRECRDDYAAGVAAAQKGSNAIVNLSQFRRVDLDDADLVSLPGYYDKRFIHCDQGCQYYQEDLTALKPAVAATNSPAILVSHGPPHGTAPTAIDFAGEAGNVGDLNLTTFVRENRVSFGVFANIHEAGGKATNLDGSEQIKQDTLVGELYLNSGPADSERWAMNDGTESVGMAAVVTIQGKLAKYKVYRAKALTSAEKTQAEKLAAKMQAGK